MRAARVGAIRATSDLDMSATRPGISLVSAGALWSNLSSGSVDCVCKCMTETAQLCWKHQPFLPVSASGMTLFSSQMGWAGYSRPTSYLQSKQEPSCHLFTKITGVSLSLLDCPTPKLWKRGTVKAFLLYCAQEVVSISCISVHPSFRLLLWGNGGHLPQLCDIPSVKNIPQVPLKNLAGERAEES